MINRYLLFLIVLTMPIWQVCLSSEDGGAYDENISNLYQSTAVSSEAISLPEGDATISGLSSELTHDQSNVGDFSFDFAIELPSGVNKFTPDLHFSYSSSSGGGEFGLGFILSVPKVSRSVKRGNPTYTDTDEFESTLDGALVEVISDSSDYRLFAPKINKTQNLYQYHENANRWVLLISTGKKIILGGNDKSISINSSGTFAWQATSEVDPFGNKISYSYFKEGGYSYLENVAFAYLNDVPHYSVKFYYQSRSDVTTSYRSNYPVTLLKRCYRIEVISGTNHVIRSYNISYNEDSVVSKVESIKLLGENDQDTIPPYPLLSFKYYSTSNARSTKSRLVAFNDVKFPPSLSKGRVTLIDMNKDSLPDIIETSYYGASVWINNGNNQFDAHYSLPEFVHNISDNNVKLLDVDGDRSVDVVGTGLYPRFFKGGERESDGRYSFSTDPSSIEKLPPYSIGSGNIRTVDVNGDGKLDILVRELSTFNVYLNSGGGSWDKVNSNELNTSSYSFSSRFMFFADMNGDSLADMVFARPTGVIYLPNRGNGLFDSPKRVLFNESSPIVLKQFRINKYNFVTDINGDGLADLVSAYSDGLTYSLNLGNDLFSESVLIDDIHQTAFNTKGLNITNADIDGNGVTDIIWSNDFADFRAFDLYSMKPNLMVEQNNGMGLVTVVNYKRARDYFDSSPSNRSNILPFPSYVVSSIVKSFWDSQTVTFQKDYAYYAPFYDGILNEFRGFNVVDQFIPSDDSAPASVQRKFYHQGRVEYEESIYQKSLVYSDKTYQFNEENYTFGELLKGTETEFSDVELYVGIEEDSKMPFSSRVKSIEGDTDPTTSSRLHAVTNEVTVSDNIITSRKVSEYFENGERYRYWIVDYATPTTNYVLNRASDISLYSSTDKLLKRERNYYDNNEWGEVSNGSLTMQKRLLGNSYEVKGFYTYYSNGLLNTVSDADGNTTTISYDSHSLNPTMVVTPENLSKQATYNSDNGKMLTVTDENGLVTSFSYDSYLRLVKIIGPTDTSELPTQVNNYYFGTSSSDPSRVLIGKRFRSGEDKLVSTYQFFDPLGRNFAKTKTAGTGNYILYDASIYNLRGKVSQTFNPEFVLSPLAFSPSTIYSSMFAFDELGRLVSIENPESTSASPSIITYQYKVGEKLTTDEENRTSIEYFDIFNRRVQYENALSNSVNYSWNEQNKVSKIVAPNGDQTLFTYDSEGRRICKLDPTTGVSLYSYDTRDNIISQSDYGFVAGMTECAAPIGITPHSVSLSYDGQNRILRADFPDESGTSDIVYSYDLTTSSYSKGRVSTIDFGAGSKKMDYDIYGNLSKSTLTIDGSSYGTEISYNVFGAIDFLRYSNGKVVNYRFDDSGLVSDITLLDGESETALITGVSYGETDALLSFSRANGINSTYSYYADGSNRLQSINASGVASFSLFVESPIDTLKNGFRTTVQSLELGYNKISNIVSRRDEVSGDSEVFSYDDLNQITNYNLNNVYTRSWVYNSIGNISSITEDAIKNYVYSSDRSQILTQVGNVTYVFDAFGNLVSDGSRTLSYDWNNRPTSITKDSVSTSYFYDEEGIRVKKINANSTSIFIDKYSEITDSSEINHIYLNSDKIVTLRGNEVVFNHSDHLGSSVASTDMDGNILSTNSYNPFGSKRASSGVVTIPYRYTGQYEDSETDLYYYKARYYDPVLSRFITADPLFLEEMDQRGKTVLDLNLYAYVKSSPMVMVDPSGCAIEYANLKSAIYFADSVNSISATAEGRSLINRLETSSDIFTIQASYFVRYASATQSDQTVRINPTWAGRYSYIDTPLGGVSLASETRILAHELLHLDQWNNDEIQTVSLENKVMSQLDDLYRMRYDDIFHYNDAIFNDYANGELNMGTLNGGYYLSDEPEHVPK